MALTPRLIQVRSLGVSLGLVAASLFTGSHLGYAGEASTTGPQIEYITPDGKLSSLSASNSDVQQSTATFVDQNTISCALKEGETTFIIELPNNVPRDRFTFLNENAAACGELRIAVSNSPLPADSPKWTEVDGIVPFAHKRLFKLSILGVDTKFVRLSFRVEDQEEKTASISNPFRNSILAETLNSNFAKFGSQLRELNLAAMSVAPLPATSIK
jgi:hypothetical protein